MKKVFIFLMIISIPHFTYAQQHYKYVINDRTIDIINSIMLAENPKIIKEILSDSLLCTSNREYLPKGLSLDSFGTSLYKFKQEFFTNDGITEFKIVYIKTTYPDSTRDRSKYVLEDKASGGLLIYPLQSNKIDMPFGGNMNKSIDHILIYFTLLHNCDCWKLESIGMYPKKL